MNQAQLVFIRCDAVGKGMFPSEVIVEIRTADGKVVTFLADSGLLSENPLRIRATRLGIDSDNVSVCLLPSENTDTGSRWFRIKDKDLQVARS